MNKKIILGLVFVVIVLVAIGILYFKKPKPEKTAEVLINNTTSLGESTSTNPMSNKPDINPADKSNPFSSIKTNPFE